MRYSKAFSLVEVLLCLVVLGLLGASTLSSVVSLKRQDVAIQRLLLETSSVYETQLFINKMLSFADIDSIKISADSLSWSGYDRLFLDSKGSNFMDFSLDKSPFVISLQNNNLYFNGSLLLDNVKLFNVKISNIATDKILEYTLCANICISDFIFLDPIEITYK